ncbi:hypothetical protein BH23BAC1_BH23BAC1_23350 [soil metagenome]
MKKVLKDWYNDDTDALLFDYLEGELPKEAASELEEKITGDIALQEELQYWTEAYFEQEFYNIENLEKIIQQKTCEAVNPSVKTYVLIFALLTSLLSLVPLTVEKDTLNKLEPGTLKELPKVNIITNKAEIPSFTNTNAPAVAKEPYFRNKSLLPAPSPAVEPLSLVANLKFLPLNTLPTDIVNLPEVEIRKISPPSKEKSHLTKIPTPAGLTRKELKAIKKSKEIALQKRREQQFIKGRKPYVVPLNKNF